MSDWKVDSRLIRIYELKPQRGGTDEFRFGDTDDEFRSISGVKFCLNTWWAFGSGVVLRSTDGMHWVDLSNEFNSVERFGVKAFVGSDNEAFVFSQSRDGLSCRYMERGLQRWRSLPPVPSFSGSVIAACTHEQLMICVKDEQGSRLMRLRGNRTAWEQLPVSFPGVASYLELADSGEGICTLWGIKRTRGFRDPDLSAIYSTRDGGATWGKIQEVDTMLLDGASSFGRPTLLGGSNGYIAEGNVDRFTAFSLSTPDGVAAVACDQFQQACVLESDDDMPVQTLLWRDASSRWRSFNLDLADRVAGIEFVGFGVVLLGTRKSLYIYRVELFQ